MLETYFSQLTSVLTNQLIPWVVHNGTSILLSIVIAIFLIKLSDILINKFLFGYIGKYNNKFGYYEKKRADTLARTLTSTARIIIIVLVIIFILDQLGFNTTALVASAGIAAAALGFGAQSLVKDLISGVFILAENQYRVGDYVYVSQIYGKVEQIGLRTTVVRGEDDVIHYIPNGEIKQSANFSKRKSSLFLDITVDADSDVNKTIEIINIVGTELAKDKEYMEYIIKPPYFGRLEMLTSVGILFRVYGQTKPNKQFMIASEFRRRLANEFSKNKIKFGEATWKIIKINNEPSRRYY